MLAGDVMTRDVIAIASDATAMQAAALMLKHEISGLPVVDSDGTLVGMVTEGDFLRRSELGTQRRRPRWLEFLIGPGRLASDYVHACGRKITDIMTTEPCSATEWTPLAEIVQLMERHRIKRVPVVCGRRLVGIVTRADLLRAYASHSADVEPVTTDDATIRKRVIAELAAQAWAPLAQIDVHVHGGVIELRGSITDERQRQAAMVAAENVPGVKAVRDRLVWIEPISGMTVVPEADTAPAGARA